MQLEARRTTINNNLRRQSKSVINAITPIPNMNNTNNINTINNINNKMGNNRASFGIDNPALEDEEV